MNKESNERASIGSPIEATILNPSYADWDNKIDNLRIRLGAPDNPYLFPPHFIKKTLISIGGEVLEFKNSNNELVGGGFLFPRKTEGGVGYTLRLHLLPKEFSIDSVQDLLLLTEELINKKFGKKLPVNVYIPEKIVNVQGVEAPRKLAPGLVIERTPPQDMGKIRELQKKIWGVTNEDFLYPQDIHSSDFSLRTSLIAYLDSKPVGFLFGFDKFCSKELPNGLRNHVKDSFIRQESQLMGVLPEFRAKNIAFQLKIKQGQQALDSGTEVVNWTFDPLLSENAVLNINKLKGLVWEHSPNYYAFTGANKLNQVSASPFTVNWMVSSPRVKEVANKETPQRRILDELVREGKIPVINGTKIYDPLLGEEIRAINPNFFHSVDASQIAIEIPVNWTLIQNKDIQLAREWRDITDAIFHEYIGASDGRYVITDVIVLKKKGVANRTFLIGQQISNIGRIFLAQDPLSLDKN